MLGNVSGGRRTLYRPFQCRSVDDEKLTVHEERLHKHSSTPGKQRWLVWEGKERSGEQKAQVNRFTALQNFWKGVSIPSMREKHTTKSFHTSLWWSQISQLRLRVQKLLVQTRHTEHTSARNRVPWKSFPELLRTKQRQVTMCRSLLSPAPICCFPEDGTEWAHDQNKTERKSVLVVFYWLAPGVYKQWGSIWLVLGLKVQICCVHVGSASGEASCCVWPRGPHGQTGCCWLKSLTLRKPHIPS